MLPTFFGPPALIILFRTSIRLRSRYCGAGSTTKASLDSASTSGLVTAAKRSIVLPNSNAAVRTDSSRPGAVSTAEGGSSEEEEEEEAEEEEEEEEEESRSTSSKVLAVPVSSSAGSAQSCRSPSSSSSPSSQSSREPKTAAIARSERDKSGANDSGRLTSSLSSPVPVRGSGSKSSIDPESESESEADEDSSPGSAVPVLVMHKNPVWSEPKRLVKIEPAPPRLAVPSVRVAAAALTSLRDQSDVQQVVKKKINLETYQKRTPKGPNVATAGGTARDHEVGANIRKRPRGADPYTDQENRFLNALEASPGLLSYLSHVMNNVG